MTDVEQRDGIDDPCIVCTPSNFDHVLKVRVLSRMRSLAVRSVGQSKLTHSRVAAVVMCATYWY
jgi:hypothetical protein